MTETNGKTFDIKVRLTMLDYFRYYFSLFNMRISGKIINILSAVIILLYSLSLFSVLYIAFSTGVFNWDTIKKIILSSVIIILFSMPFIRTYLIAYKDAKTHDYLDKDIDVRITEDKFIVFPENSKQEFFWKKMYRILAFSHGFALFIDKKGLVFVLPMRCFKSKDHIDFIKEIIAKYKK